MATKNVQNAINIFKKNLEGKIHVSGVLLFGSRKAKTHADTSDIDVVVVSSDFSKMSEDTRLDVLYKASRFIEPEIHPWAVTPEELEEAHTQTMIGNIREYGQPL